MAESFIRYGKIYSIDLMISYVNLFKPKEININVKDFEDVLAFKVWNEGQSSPIDVLEDPKNESHKDDFEKINKADLKYAIFLDANSNIINGHHRLTKAFLNNKKTLKAIMFDDKLIEKFKLSNKATKKELVRVILMPPFKLIDMFVKRFSE